jgi:hypothetical protein
MLNSFHHLHTLEQVFDPIDWTRCAQLTSTSDINDDGRRQPNTDGAWHCPDVANPGGRADPRRQRLTSEGPPVVGFGFVDIRGIA